MNSYEEFRMSDSSNSVQAIYKFKGSNNDELMFDIGDVITVTQREDGGWWEGTHSRRGKTGWFPSNYVRVLDDSSQDNSKYCIPKTEDMTDDDKAQLMLGSLIIQKGIDNRKQVIEDLLKKEMDFIRCLTAIQKTFLEPLSSTNMLNEVEFKQLVGNLDELLDIHRALYDEVELVSTLSPREQRIGKIFLEYGAEIRLAHMKYWGNHPKAVCILEKYKDTLDTYMESKGASKPGLTVLTTSLSRPFRQLEKYAGICQELEQHFENDHPDRGDTQRSIGFYKDVAAECAKARRQKELELEVLKGTIRNWEGEDLNSLGDILHIGPVIATISGEKKDRHFVLFSSTLLILSVSQRMSAFIYEGKLPLSGISVNRLEDIESVKNAFEITGPMIERILIVCNSKNDSLKWVDLLRGQIKSCRNTSLLNTNSHSNYAPSLAPFPTPPPHVSYTPPPYTRLTEWTSRQIELGYLPLPTPQFDKQRRYSFLLRENPVKKRTKKVGCMIFPFTPETLKRTLQDYSDKRIGNDSDDEFSLIIPDLLMADDELSNEGKDDCLASDWKKFPHQQNESSLAILRSFEKEHHEINNRRLSLTDSDNINYLTKEMNNTEGNPIILDEDDYFVQRYIQKKTLDKSSDLYFSSNVTSSTGLPQNQLFTNFLSDEERRSLYKSYSKYTPPPLSHEFKFKSTLEISIRPEISHDSSYFKSSCYVHWWMTAELKKW